MGVKILNDLLRGFIFFILYYIISLMLLLVFRYIVKPPKEVFRKMLHLTCAFSTLVLLYYFDLWYLALGVIGMFIVMVYPILSFVEKFPRVRNFLVSRKSGELKSSLLIIYLTIAVLILLFWGILGEEYKYIIVVAVMAWGFGDATAALVGKAIGKNHIKHPLVDPKKTKEGSIAMFIIAGCATFISLIIYRVAPWHISFLIAIIVSYISTIVELISHNGIDTLTVPLSASIPLFIIIRTLEVLGV